MNIEAISTPATALSDWVIFEESILEVWNIHIASLSNAVARHPPLDRDTVLPSSASRGRVLARWRVKATDLREFR